jgi:hypothetical protein
MDRKRVTPALQYDRRRYAVYGLGKRSSKGGVKQLNNMPITRHTGDLTQVQLKVL